MTVGLCVDSVSLHQLRSTGCSTHALQETVWHGCAAKKMTRELHTSIFGRTLESVRRSWLVGLLTLQNVKHLNAANNYIKRIKNIKQKNNITYTFESSKS